MQTDIEIAVIVMGAILLGGLLRMAYGWAKAKEAGESFSKYKFIITFIGMMIASCALFVTVNFSTLEIGGSGLVGLIVTFVIGGFLAESDIGKITEAVAGKFGINGG